MTSLGVIGGSGMSSLKGFRDLAEKVVSTPYGEPSSPLLTGKSGGLDIVLLARHGLRHQIAPHRINYRANLRALSDMGVDRIIAINTVGAIDQSLEPPCIAVPEQIVDYTWGREHSYFDAPPDELKHVDFTEPFCGETRQQLLAALQEAGIDGVDGGTYGVTQGPRLETAGEIDRMARDGCDLVGMTGMPEAALARELDLKYACCAVVVNMAAGRGGEIHAEIAKNLEEGMAQVARMLEAISGSV